MPLLNKIVQLPYGWGFRWGVCTVCAWPRGPIRPPSCSFDSVLAKVSSRLCTNCCAVSGGGLAAGPHRPPQPGGNVYTPLGTQLIYHIYTCRSAAYDTRLSQVLLIRFLKRPCYKVRTSRPRALPVPAAVASSQEKEWAAKRVTVRLFEGVHDDAAARAHSHRVSACMLVCTIDAARVERCTHRGRAQTRRCVAGHRGTLRSGSNRYTLQTQPSRRPSLCANARHQPPLKRCAIPSALLS